MLKSPLTRSSKSAKDNFWFSPDIRDYIIFSILPANPSRDFLIPWQVFMAIVRSCLIRPKVQSIKITEAASQIGVSRVTLSRVLNGRAAVSPDMALRLEAWLGIENGGRAETWLTHQLVYDLWRARQKVA